jgi:poly-gamma-glutamate synthesis protein (capsule biosynthesis protein)
MHDTDRLRNRQRVTNSPYQVGIVNGRKKIACILIVILVLVAAVLVSANVKRQEPITMVFGGDCAFVHSFERVVQDHYRYPFAKLDWFRRADIRMINLENPISLRGDKTPKEFNFRMHPKYLGVLKDANINVVCLANNHIYDYGKDALLDTLSYLDSAGIRHVGAGENLSMARKPVILEVNRKKIGFLAYYGNGSWYPASEGSPGTAPRIKALIRDDLRALRENEKVDFIVVNYHWGQEGSNYPEPFQVDLAHFTVECGANLIIGHHPHVLQGIEKYKNGIIVYSLGNFLFGYASSKEYDTAIFKLVIDQHQVLPQIIPIHIASWQASLLTGKGRETVLSKLREYSMGFRESIF